MSGFHKTIKYIAVGFAVFLAIMIVAGIANFIFAIVSAVSGGRSFQDNKTIDFNETFTGVTSLAIDNSTGKLEIRQGNEFKVEAENVNEGFIAEVSHDGTLRVSDDDSHFGFLWFNFSGFNNPNSKVVVYLPDSFIAEDATIDSGAGSVLIEGLYTDNLDISAGAGTISGEDVSATHVTIDGGVGSVTLKNVDFNDTYLNCGVGNVKLDGILIGHTEVDCGVGSVNLELLGDVDDYDLEVDSGVGTIRLNGEKISDDYETDKNAPNSISIEGGVGDVKININE